MTLPPYLDIWRDTLQWQPTDPILQRFDRLLELILEGNQRLNLTRITEADDFWEKHLWDSLSGIFHLPSPPPSGTELIDLGTGAGFPGVPIAIVFPEITVTLLDSTRKKIDFLRELTATLELTNTKLLLGRAETIGKSLQHYSKYDIVTLRAVTNAPVCLQYALPFLKTGGTAILYRGSWTEAEKEELERVAAGEGAIIEKIQPLSTPLTKSVRHCIYVSKRLPGVDRSVKLKPR